MARASSRAPPLMAHDPARCDLPVCGWCDAYGDGYTVSKDKLEHDLRGRLDTQHMNGCGCRPCELIGAVTLAVADRALWTCGRQP